MSILYKISFIDSTGKRVMAKSYCGVRTFSNPEKAKGWCFTRRDKFKDFILIHPNGDEAPITFKET